MDYFNNEGQDLVGWKTKLEMDGGKNSLED